MAKIQIYKKIYTYNLTKLHVDRAQKKKKRATYF